MLPRCPAKSEEIIIWRQKNRTKKFRKVAFLRCKRQQRSDHGESGATLWHGLHRAFKCRCKSASEPRARDINVRNAAHAFVDLPDVATDY